MESLWLANPWLVAAMVFGVAILYSTVGHGGASGYLAIMTLVGFPAASKASTALVLNILVAGIAWIEYARAGHPAWRTARPFLMASIPAALVGSLLRLSDQTYALLLALALLTAAARLVVPMARSQSTETHRSPRLPVAVGIGGVIGLVSGMVGIGGGIFLSPILILARWADVKTTSAAAACFITVNSVVGIAGRVASGTFSGSELGFLPAVAFFGGLIGAHTGVRWIPVPVLRRVLAVVLLFAVFKLAVSSA